MDQYNLLVWAMNGKPLESIHGAPLRLVIPGWPGSVSHKWLTKITLRDKVHDGPGMTGTSYRVAIKPMLPGGKADDSNFKILESMPVRSIITSPANGTRLGGRHQGGQAQGRGLGRRSRGQGRRTCRSTSAPPGRRPTSRRPRTATTGGAGRRRSRCRATATTRSGCGRPTSANKSQPHIAGNWNPQGYGANPMHRIAVLVG